MKLPIHHAAMRMLRILPSRWIARALGMLLCVTGVGCQPAAGAGQAKAAAGRMAEDTVSVMTDSVNYMHKAGVQYTLYDLSRTPPVAVGGAIVYMLGSGGEKGCCLNLPRAWRPGLKVRLKWFETDRERSYEERSRDLEIPRYETPADVYVVFHPEHDVELVVSAAEPGHPAWRGRVNKTPWEQCLSENDRKICKAALPKQFDTASDAGACTYMKENNTPDGDNLCAFATEQCMRDHEDESFCKDLLWGPSKR